MEKDLEIVSQPKIEVVQCEKGKSFIFTAEVALKPPVELGKYKGVKIEKVDAEVTDEDVDKEIEREQESNARTITVEDRPVKEKDTAIIDFEGFVDGKVNHVGIVEKVENNRVYTVEGNSNEDTGRQKDYDINSKVIFGYGTPAY